MHAYRTHTCAQLRASDVDTTARISGWIHRKRDHGGLLFVDLRDHYGLTQCVLEPESPHFEKLERARVESVVTITGKVVARSKETVNPNLPTGGIELRVEDFEIQSAAEELPMPVFGEPEWSEEVRLKHRFLDLRRETLHANIMRRVEVIRAMREKMAAAGFFEFATPILTASSPEGARDFLVPSRLHPGKFYALPQAPQQYKQLIMVSGFDRYFQIAPCFRDEDPRADRLPGEFYQLDVEMSFVEEEDVYTTMEPIIREIFADFAEGKPVTAEFPRIPYDEAMAKYGTDKPDLRNPIEMQDVTPHFAGSGFKIFAGMIEKNPKVRVWAVPAPSGGSRAFCDRMNSWAQKEGQPGLGYIFFRDGEGAGPIAKNIGEDRTNAIRQQLDLNDGDAVFFVAGMPSDFAAFAGKARDRVGSELNLVDEDRFALAWIVDFPMYEWDEDNKKIDFSHNPFSMPRGGLAALEAAEKDGTDALLALKAQQYDLVCNGFEIASGSIRNHIPETMIKAFGITGLGPDVVKDRFGALYRAFQYGAPPHGGMAAGVDRIVMLLVGAKNLREVSLFPMNQQAADLLMNSPADADAAQLRELSLRVVLPDAKKS
jgi:aspartyl-tRNA synthetase